MAAIQAVPSPKDPTADPTAQPFGLPTGSVRGILSVLICSFFWLVLLYPQAEGMTPRPMLAHYFLLGLVMMAFASHPHVVERGQSPFLPWLLRVLFVGGTVAAVGVAMFRNMDQFTARMTPDPEEVKQWWTTFLGSMSGGFAIGLLMRFLLGRSSLVFRSIRAWLSIVGIVMLLLELVLFQGFIGATQPPTAFISFWQCAELVVVAAYFGTRT